MIEGLSALLSLLRVSQHHDGSIPRYGGKTRPLFSFKNPFRSSVIECRSWKGSTGPQNDLESLLVARLGPHRLGEALGQVRAFSPDRIQWVARPGADVFKMTVAAVKELGSEEVELKAKLTSRGIRFRDENIVIDIGTGERGDVEFTAYTQQQTSVKESSPLAKCASASIAVDLACNFRSYSWHESSQNSVPLFDSRNPFGEMESIFDHFFNPQFEQGSGWDDRKHSVEQGPGRGGYEPVISRAENRSGNAVQELEAMGAQVIVPAGNNGGTETGVDWSSLAGYNHVKSQVEESIILGLKHSSLFEKLVKKTRKSTRGSNRPKVVLFQGPPGTGKTSTCKIIANETNIPMIHIPLESIVSKWFGESEKHIARFYELGKQVAKNGNYNGVILFIDEIDSLVSSRDFGSSHEASKRILSVLLRHIDGFTNNETGRHDDIPTILICATNRPQDLDSAFMNRVDSSVEFGLPDFECRKAILELYAKHLKNDELSELAKITAGLSGRNLKDICQSTERVWTSTIIRRLGGQVEDTDVVPPPLSVYLKEAVKKQGQQKINRE